MDEDRVPLPHDDFRRERKLLAAHVFALVEGDDIDPTDVIDQEAWESIMDLPTDVAIRTTSYSGTIIENLHSLHWVDLLMA
jgi:hypothetical protein